MVEYVQHRKCYSALSNPVFNLLDSTSLLTWLDMRTLMKDVGLPFKIRLQFNIAFTSALLAAQWLLIIA
jgi:hypothetical protein